LYQINFKSGGNTINTATFIMTKVIFTDSTTINAVARDGETFTLKTYLPVQKEEQQTIAKSLSFYLDDCFEDDKTSMIYWVLMKMMSNVSFSFYNAGSDRSEERKRIGARIREIREQKGIEAKKLATLTNIDAANLSRIEQGKYSVGLDVLSRISFGLGVKVDLV
jgi:DNA-binding Xre family transcriptional regulator